jgi:type IV pilus assembly protein PilA
MKKQQGFTLIELLIVVAIIAIIAAIAIPNLLTARMAANETSAIGALRAISSAQLNYSTSATVYADTLRELVTEGYLDARFANSGNINGYAFGVIAQLSDPVSGAVGPFTSTASAFGAAPVTLNSTGRYGYGIGGDMVVRYSTAAVTGGMAASSCPPSVTGTCNGSPVGGKTGT